MHHFISLREYNPEVIKEMIELAVKTKSSPRNYASVLSGKKLYMLFQKTSTRTALSFAAGMSDLGGQYFLQNWEDSNFAVGEIRDEVRYLGRNVDVIMARLRRNADINLMAQYSSVPVIDGCCDKYHPCQAMADMMTIKELFESYAVSMLYIGVKNNVLNSLMETLPRLGGKLYSFTPVQNNPSLDVDLVRDAVATGNYEEVVPDISPDDLHSLVQRVDVVYVDTWVDMEFFHDPSYAEEKTNRLNTMLPFQLTTEFLEGSRAMVMHEMPIHSGYEISRDIVEQNIDTILRQAENRRHAQNGVMVSLLG
jgi:ornithine carbamoyltransferase